MEELIRDESLNVKYGDAFSQFIEDLRAIEDYSESKISQEFLKLELHPSTLDLAAFSALVYTKQNEDNNWISDLLKEYVLLFIGDSKETGYKGIIYYRRNTPNRHLQIIIAHKGTENFDDWKADIDGVAKNKITPQINSCCTFVLDFLEKLSMDSPHSQKFKAQISTTGHSLGGWLSQISAFAIKYLRLAENSETFELSNSAWEIHPHCEVFDSPGACQIIQKISSLPQLRSLKHQCTNFGLDNTNFVFFPNGVNVVNQHIGDMFCLKFPKEKLDLPTNYLSWSNKTYTINTHKMSLFLESLKELGDGNPRFCMVDEWILLMFGNWDTSQNWDLSNIIHPALNYFYISCFSGAYKTFKMAIDAVSKLWNHAAADFNEKSIKSKIKVSVSPPFQVNINCLSPGVREALQILRTINILKNLDYVWSELPLSLELSEIKNLLNILNRQENDDSSNILLFSEMEELTILKNCGLLYSQIKDISVHLKNFKLASCFYFSNKYVAELLGKFIKIDFELVCKFKTAIIGLYCEELVELTCFKIASLIKQSKGELTPGNALLLRYSDLSHILKDVQTTLNELSPQIEYVFINVNCDSKLIFSTVEKLIDFKRRNLVCIFVDENSSYEKDPLGLDGNFEEILKQKITFNGSSVTLAEIMGDDTQAGLQVLQCLRSDAKKLIILLEKNPPFKLELGVAPPSIYDNINIYTEPCIKFNSVENALKVFDGPGQRTIVLFGNGSKDMEKRLKSVSSTMRTENQGGSLRLVYVEKDGSDPVSFYKKCVTQDPSSVFDLVEINLNFLEWKLHYNPNLYIKRKIIPPAIDLKPLCRLEGLNIEFPPGTGFVPLSLSLKLDLSDSSDNRLTTRAVLSQTFPDIPSSNFIGRKCLRLTPERNGGCQISLLDPDNEIKPLEWNYNPKRVLEEDMLLEANVKDVRELNCFSDAPGMGKSFLMASLSNKLLAKKTQQKNWIWLFFLELREFGTFHSIKFPKDDFDKLDIEELVDFFTRYLKLDQFQALIFKNLFCSNKNSSKLSFFLDGFDELPDEHKKNFCRILLHLRKYTNVGITISTRSWDNTPIETSLGILSHHLVPFEELETFLYNTWSGVIVQPEVQTRLFEFANSLLEKVSESMMDQCQFLGIPLHLKMLSVAFQEAAFAYSRGDPPPGIMPDTSPDAYTPDHYFPPEYSFRTLIDRFIDTKYKIFFRKLGWQDCGGLHWNNLKHNLIYKFERELESLGGAVLGLGSEFEGLMWEAWRESQRTFDFLLNLYRVGLLFKVREKPEFLHRSIAEYYVANCLYHCFQHLTVLLLKENSKDDIDRFVKALVPVCISAIFQRSSRLVRSFFNEMIEADSKLKLGLCDSLKRSDFPLIVVPGEELSNPLVACLYQVLKNEIDSEKQFAIDFFLKWGQIYELVFFMIFFNSFTNLGHPDPLKEDQIMSCSFNSINGNEEIILKLVMDQRLSDWALTVIMDILRLKKGYVLWLRFRDDLENMLKEWPFFKDRMFLNYEVGNKVQFIFESRIRVDRLVGNKEFEIHIGLTKWFYEFMEKVWLENELIKGVKNLTTY